MTRWQGYKMSAPKMFAHHWISGDWVDSQKRMGSINPATGETIGTYTEAGAAEATPTHTKFSIDHIAAYANRKCRERGVVRAT